MRQLWDHAGPGLSKCEGDFAGNVHMVILDNLVEHTTYYFEVLSGGLTESNGGNYYSFTTASIGAGKPYLLYGNIVSGDEDVTIGSAVITAHLIRGDILSHPVISLVRPDGVWMLNLGNLKNSSSGDIAPFEDGDVIIIESRDAIYQFGTDTIIVRMSARKTPGHLR